MNNLWIFGCSYSDVSQTKDNLEYVKWKGYITKHWSEILADKLGFKLNNLGYRGASNLHIFESFCKVCHKIENNDIVIINWTDTSRFRVADDRWYRVLSHHISDIKLKEEKKRIRRYCISEITIKEMVINRSNKLYEEELDNWYNLINSYCNSIDALLLSWGFITYRNYMVNMGNFSLFDYIKNNFGTISNETNNEVLDSHFSENANDELARIFYEKITGIETKKNLI